MEPDGGGVDACAARVLGFATQGSGGDDEARLRALLEPLSAEILPFDRRAKSRSFRDVLRALGARRPDLVVMEGTGWAGGLALILGRLWHGIPYVISSGDAVGPFVTAQSRLAGPVFSLYERWLCRLSAGFIGWSPYLTGRALTFGAPRAMTAAGWAPFAVSDESERREMRARTRARLGITAESTVIGIVGSLAWNRRVGFCYGAELVGALSRLGSDQTDVVAVIVGDGNGRAHLEQQAGDRLGRSVILTGRVPRAEVPQYLAAFDLASLPQSVDGVGSFRYTTKLSEYLAAGLPVVTGQIPLAYDLDTGWLWRLPGANPWDSRYLDALAALLASLTPDALSTRRAAVPSYLPEFDRALEIPRVASFLRELLASARV